MTLLPTDIVSGDSGHIDWHEQLHALLNGLIPTTGNIRYVGGINASDTNTGVSPGAPLATLLAAYDALPATGGRVIVMPGATMGGAVDGQGAWFLHTSGGALSAGYRTLKPVVFQGLGGYYRGLNPAFENDYKVQITNTGTASVSKPCIAVAASSSNMPIVFRDVAFSGWLNGVWLGMKQDLTEPLEADNIGTVGYRMDNCTVDILDSGPSSGVWSVRQGGSDVAQTFMNKFHRTSFTGRCVIGGVQQDETSLNAYAVYSTNSSYLYLTECTSVRGGGIWFETRSDEPMQLHVDDFHVENDFGFQGTSLVRLVGGVSFTSRVYLNNVDSADIAASDVNGSIDTNSCNLEATCIEINGGVRGAGARSRIVTGPATLWGVHNISSGYAMNLAEEGQLGQDRDRIVFRHDAAPRAGLAVARFANSVSQNFADAGWAESGTGTVSTGELDPFQNNQAMLLTPTADGNYDSQYTALSGVTLALNDHIVWGGWVQALNTTSGLNFGGDFIVSTAGMSGVTYNRSLTLSRRNAGRGEWQFVVAKAKVTSTGSDSTGDVRLTVRAKQNSGTAYPAVFSHPFLMHVPATQDLTDAEVAEMALHLSSIGETSAGGVATLPRGVGLWAPSRRDVGPFVQDDVAASQTNVRLNVYGDTTRNTIPRSRAGSVIGMVVSLDEAADARTAGSLTAEAVIVNGTTKAETPTGFTVLINGSNTIRHTGSQAPNLDNYAAGDELTVRITTTGTWAPTTGDVTVMLEVME